MLYHLANYISQMQPEAKILKILNVFRYITFRSAVAIVLALLISLLIAPAAIRMLRRLKIGQNILKLDAKDSVDLSEIHEHKSGTPTMGGVIILVSILIPVLLVGNLTNRYVIIMIIATIWMAGVGFIDDYIKLVKKRNKGLGIRQKFIGQLILVLGLGGYLYFGPPQEIALWSNGQAVFSQNYSTHLSFPFFKNFHPDLGLFFIIFVGLVIIGSTNAVNLTDGLDGLAIGGVIIAAITYAIIAYIVGTLDFSMRALIFFVKGTGEMTVFLSAVVGAGLGFLWFNCNPAQVFMGDTGSLMLGGILGTAAVLVKQEILLILVGGLFVIEALSVILQIGSFKLRKKRVFRMAPLHHHFELCGWMEPKIIVRFWIIALLCSLVALATFKLR